MRFLFVIVLGGLLFFGIAQYRTKIEGEPFGSIKIIDAHTHTEFTNTDEAGGGFSYGKEELKKQMDENNIVGIVAHSSRHDLPLSDLSDVNVIRCLAVTEDLTIEKAAPLLESKKFRCLKVYLGYIYKWAGDPLYRKFYRLAEEKNVPVVFHTGDVWDKDGKLKYADPLTIDEVAVDFRRVKFVIAHLGNPWIQSAAEVAYKNPNVYVEASALMVGKLGTYSQGETEEYAVKPIRWAFSYIENPKKFMFGTDWPLVPMEEYIEIYKRAIPREHWKAVFHDNAKEVFGF